jgi:hypothetical protein
LFPFTLLHTAEVRNALNLGVFRLAFSATEAAAAWSNVEQDLRGGRLANRQLRWAMVFRRAVDLSDQYSVSAGTRSLALLHVAAAIQIKAREFVSFDNVSGTSLPQWG